MVLMGGLELNWAGDKYTHEFIPQLSDSIRRNGDSERRCRSRVSEDASESQYAIVLLHDTAADPEAESSALDGLGCKEGVEELSGILLGDASSGIGDKNLYPGCFTVDAGMFIDADTHSTTFRHSLYRICYEIHENLFQLGGKSMNLPLS